MLGSGPIELEDIFGKSAPSRESAHPTHFKTAYENPVTGIGTHGITKENKKGKPQASKLEAGFSAIANLVMLPEHNTKMSLIKNKQDNTVYGVFSEHAAYIMIRKQEKEDAKLQNLIAFQNNLIRRFHTDSEERLTRDLDALEKKSLDSWLADGDNRENYNANTMQSAIKKLVKEHQEITAKHFQNLISMQESERDELLEQRTVFLQVPNFALVEGFAGKVSVNGITKKDEAAFFQQITSLSPIESTAGLAEFAIYEQEDPIWLAAIVAKHGVKQAEAEHHLSYYLKTDRNVLITNIANMPSGQEFYKELMERALLIQRCISQNPINRRTAYLVKKYDVKAGFNFLHDTPPNFFAKLMKARAQGLIEIDMDSLADVMCTAYGLEEDDLHKGNIGFYLTKTGNNPPSYHFFKIDHDLMFNAKIMATKDQRESNITYTSNTFKIKAEDLLTFPDVAEGPHYWPTRNPTITTGRKSHDNKESRDAFKQLQFDEAFIKAKWTRFFKQAVLPLGSIKESLKDTYRGVEVTAEHSETLRQTREKFKEMRLAVLEIFAVPKFSHLPSSQRVILQKRAIEFRESFISNNQELRQTIMTEIEGQMKDSGLFTESEIASFVQEIQQQFILMKDVAFNLKNEEYSLLHAAILTNCYRAPLSMSEFGNSLNAKDKKGLTPLDYAIRQYEFHDKMGNNPIERANLYSVIKDLIYNNAECTTYSKSNLESYFMTVPKLTSLKEFEDELRELTSSTEHIVIIQREALALLKAAKLTPKELDTIKSNLMAKEPQEPYTFLKRLDSKYYVSKKIKGEYGDTEVSTNMMKCISAQLPSVSRNPFSHFGSKKTHEAESTADPNLAPPPSLGSGKSDGH